MFNSKKVTVSGKHIFHRGWSSTPILSPTAISTMEILINIGAKNTVTEHVNGKKVDLNYFNFNVDNSDVEVSDEVLQGKITGTIFTEAQSTVAGVSVTVSQYGVDVKSTTTNASGSYSIGQLNYGAYDVLIEFSRSDVGTISETSTIIVDSETVHSDFGPFITVNNVGNVTGSVVSTTGTPLVATVTMSVLDTVYNTTTDTKGVYTFNNKEYGDYKISATSEGVTESGTISVNSDSHTKNFTLKMTSDILGTVKHHDGSSVGVVTVDLLMNDGVVKTTTASDVGVFTFSDVEFGSYTISTSKDGLVGELQVEVTSAGISDIVVKLPEPVIETSTVSGKVMNSDGTPASSILVELIGEKTITANTNSNGKYTFSDVVFGEYMIHVSEADYEEVINITTSTLSIDNIVIPTPEPEVVEPEIEEVEPEVVEPEIEEVEPEVVEPEIEE